MYLKCSSELVDNRYIGSLDTIFVEEQRKITRNLPYMQLVWAKLPDRPWFPGIIINPDSIQENLDMVNIIVKKPPSQLFLDEEYRYDGNLGYYDTGAYYLVFLLQRKNPW
jgi:hypothetical protein